MSATEERAFRAELAAAGGVAPKRISAADARSNTTAVLGALRSGLTWAALVTHLPGLNPAALARAYDELEAARQAAEIAWKHLCAHPELLHDQVTFLIAAQLLPAPLNRARTAAAHSPARNPADLIHPIAAKVRALHATVDRVEAALAAHPDPDVAFELGTRLHHPHRPSLWGDPLYLPRRITDLSPTRVADLLHERVGGDRDAD